MLRFQKNFSQKIGGKKQTKTLLNSAKIGSSHWFSRKTSIFSQNIVIVTSIPDWTFALQTLAVLHFNVDIQITAQQMTAIHSVTFWPGHTCNCIYSTGLTRQPYADIRKLTLENYLG
jgi:hypothetical protein